MVYKKTLFILFSASIIIVSSCSPYKALVRDFSNGKNDIAYIHTMPLTKIKKDIMVHVKEPTITDSKFNGDIQKIRGYLVPLIAVNVWEYQYMCSIGKNQIAEKLDSFIKSSFVEEANRSGQFKTDTVSEKPISVEIEIDSLGAKGPYTKSGHIVYLFIAYTMRRTERAGPGEAYCKYHYKVKQGDKVLLEDFITNKSSFQMLSPSRTTFTKFRDYYRANLVESLGNAIKKNNEELVRHLNFLFQDDSYIDSSE